MNPIVFEPVRLGLGNRTFSSELHDPAQSRFIRNVTAEFRGRQLAALEPAKATADTSTVKGALRENIVNFIVPAES